ncbi:MAG: hypothetical protein LBR83_00385 [Clostridiales bacterium]|jgi:hypothetical protein|nr:hypothetical protein [Clostridiales bacterium]
MDVSFATYAASKRDLICNYLLANSIRDFAGDLSGVPLRVYIPSSVDMQKEIARFAALNVIFARYPKAGRFPYAFKSAAASACEADVKEGAVIWLDRHMIIPSPCAGALLDPRERFAYLRASAEEPAGMWAAACKIAGVDESALFPVHTVFSAGHFSFRAEAGIMGEWDALFNELAGHPDMKIFFDDYSKVSLHEIALTLAVLKNQDKNTLKPLPAFYGYPTHLHEKMEKKYQAKEMDVLHTAFYSCNNGVKPNMPVMKPLMEWLRGKVSEYNGDRWR